MICLRLLVSTSLPFATSMQTPRLSSKHLTRLDHALLDCFLACLDCIWQSKKSSWIIVSSPIYGRVTRALLPCRDLFEHAENTKLVHPRCGLSFPKFLTILSYTVPVFLQVRYQCPAPKSSPALTWTLRLIIWSSSRTSMANDSRMPASL